MTPIIIKLIIGAVAVLLVIASLISYFKKKMDEKTTIGWCAFGILITIAAPVSYTHLTLPTILRV